MKERVFKKCFAVFFSAALLFSVASCSTDVDNNTENDEIVEEEQAIEDENIESVRCIHRTGGEVGHLTVKARNPRNSRNSSRRR